MLFSTDNAKAIKARKYGFINAELYLSPAASAEVTRNGKVIDLCPYASPGCRALCLNTSGMGIFSNVQAARIMKTNQLFADWPGFVEELANEVHTLQRQAKKAGLKLAIRPNGTSDLPRLATDLMNAVDDPSVLFYDYTKVPHPGRRVIPGRYHLTFSRSELNDVDCREAVREGVNVAVVFSTTKSEDLPKTYLGKKVVDGDLHDLRFLDPQGVVVGLRAKGFARHAAPGFVVTAT